MSTKTVVSKQFSLNIRDISRGLIVAVLGAVVPIINEAVNAWGSSNSEFSLDWQSVYKTAVSAGVAYLILNFSSRSKVITAVDSEEKVEEVKERIKRVVAKKPIK